MILRASAAIVTAFLLLGAPARPRVIAAAQAASLAELWQPPVDAAAQNLFDGPWGSEHAPDPRGIYTFVRHKTAGSSPGMIVRDARGRTWHVKQGREAPPEVVVSRVLSAIGYHQPPVYFLRTFMLADGSGLHEIPGGRFRLSDGSLKSLGRWTWEDNPFVGTKPFQALLVVLVALNSADLKNSNNSLYELRPARGEAARWYVVRDLGTSLGATGRFDPTPNDVAVFERHRFIVGVDGGYVEFAYRAVHNSLVHRRITPDDVQWASRLLGGLTDRQWRQAFQSAAYDPASADRFIRRLRQKIEQGMRIR